MTDIKTALLSKECDSVSAGVRRLIAGGPVDPGDNTTLADERGRCIIDEQRNLIVEE